MRRRILLPTLALLLLGSGCRPEFLSPRDGALTGPDVRVALVALSLRPPRIELDGEPVDPAGFETRGLRTTGTLEDVAAGAHELSARYRVLFFFPVRLRSRFEVAAVASYDVRGSVEQVFVTHATPGAALALHDRKGRVQAEGEADAQGSLVFREVPPGVGYRVVAPGTPSERSDPVDVMSVAGSTPPPSFYAAQEIEPGFGYVTTRDGTTLSLYVALPGPPEDGPYPTLVNYSGYEPSKPGGPLSLGGADLSALCGDLPVLCDAPNHPSGIIAGALGYATVGVNMRGTGCSGGAYDFFETLQLLDGYDVIETIARQPWVAHGKVGMAGLSFPGISQLFVASTRPPSLAAITPLSVISGTDTTLAPGGILNDGFALEWGRAVYDRAAPYGQGWEQGRVDAGDRVCEENQLLHSQRVDIIQKALDNPYYVPEIYDPLNPRTFVDRIEVPVFTAGQWQDEQTGGHFPDLWDRFDGAPVVRMTGTNGAHADGYAPQVLAEWKTFIDLYVAREITEVPMLIQLFSPLLFQEIFGAPVALPEPRFVPGDDFEAALAAFEAEPPVRILFESGGGAGPAGPGAPEAGFEVALSSWPPPGVVGRRVWLHEDGSLREHPPATVESASSWQHDPDKGAETYRVDDPFERALPDIEWLPFGPGRQVVFATAPLADDFVMLGHASADLWIRSTADDADLEVMLSEIRTDGQEVYVTSGWLRASQRALAPGSTPFRPIPTRLERDAAPLAPGAWTLVRVEIYPVGHVFRAGSRIRASISTPGGNKGRWTFDVLPEPATHEVSHGAVAASSLLLPELPTTGVPAELPACPGLRGQPCRPYVPASNASAP